MKNSKYLDISAINQVIGNIYNKPDLLSQEDRYKFNEEDFVSSFHKIVFTSIYNLYQLGSKNITFEVLEDYLVQRPKTKAEFEANKGYEYLSKVSEVAKEETFNYYYKRMKKMTLLRAYEDCGMDLSWLYNPDLAISNTKKLQEQEDYLDNSSLEDIANLINDKIDNVKMKFAEGASNDVTSIGSNIYSMLEELKESPDLGLPMYGPYMNTITRGCRLGKFYLRSSPSNVGKTRAMVGDICYLACSQMYNIREDKWESIGACQPSLLITTEQDQKEVQLMCLAFLSGVNENHIALNEYYAGEEERVHKAAQLLTNSKLYFVEMSDFSVQEIENTIKFNIRERGVQYIAFDYIHTSMGILSEIARQSGGVKLREDNILYLLSVKLKEIATTYQVFILSSTQLNGDWKTAEVLDMNCLRGAKAIADKIDIGFLMVETTKEDLEKIQPILTKNGFPRPNIKMSIYKNRANEHKNEYLFINADKGICRYEGLFMTDFNYNLLDVPDIKIRVEDESAF